MQNKIIRIGLGFVLAAVGAHATALAQEVEDEVRSIDGTDIQSADDTGTRSIDGTGTRSIDGTGTRSIDGTGTESIDGTGTQSATGTTYTVQSGDTLMSIARAHYDGDASRYQDIYEANRDVLNSPDDLTPGQVLTIPH